MANLIVHAQHDVFLATNFWQNSQASKYITAALKELSNRISRDPTRGKVVVKIMYDRGSVRQVLDPHHIVPEKDYTGRLVGLPRSDEIPNLDMEVMNYHKPLLGTFHAKYMVVDRRVAVLQSNNVQDNDNLEMMVHLEGDIVDAMYDMALLSWSKAMKPPMPTIRTPAAASGIRCFDGLESSASTDTSGDTHLPEHTPDEPQYDATIPAEIRRVQASVSPTSSRTRMQAITTHLNHTTNPDFRVPADLAAPDTNLSTPETFMTPYIAHAPHKPFPMTLVNRAPHGPPNHRSVDNPQNAAWLAALRCARRSVFIQSPTLNAEPLLPAIVEACERGVDVTCFICLGYNDIGELLPMQGGHNEMVAYKLHTSLSPTGRKHLRYHWYVAKDATAPIHQDKRRRSCHIKLLIADGRVAVVGNGNQDTQSWYHSQEINVMLDLPEDIAAEWIDALERRNQNTWMYGRLDEDGMWRDEDGNEADGALGVDSGRFSWGKGVVGAFKRLQGTGGF